MTAVLRLESRQRLRGSVVLMVVFGLLSAMYFAIFPQVSESADAFAESVPPLFEELFGIRALGTIEGYLAAEVYAFFWVLLLGIYFAYVGGGMIATEIDRRRMDLTLAGPVSRESVLFQTVGSLWVPLVVLNVSMAAIVLVGAALVGESMNPLAVAMVHLLSVPYLLACGAIGLVFSVTVDRARTARLGALGTVFVLWLVESASALDADWEWLGTLAPSRYYDPTTILVQESYAVVDAAMLLVGAAVLVAGATALFVRRDI